MVEFYEDLFEDKPEEMLKAAKGDDGEVIFEETGDPLIDKWEQELAQGIIPDLTEGMSPEAVSQLKQEQMNKAKIKAVGNINETYSSELNDLILGG